MGTRGRFIAFEGGEGVGKSSQAALAAEKLGALLTREPGGTGLGEAVRSMLLDESLGEVDARTELLLMVAARAEHVDKVIQPALESGRDVVCDRYSGSTLAYQGFGRGLPLEDVEVACALGANGVEPDLVVLIDLSPRDATARRSRKKDRIEQAGVAFHERVHAGFRALADADKNRWVVIDGSGSIEAVHERVVAAIEEKCDVVRSNETP